MATVVRCSNEFCPKIEEVAEGEVPPANCPLCGARMLASGAETALTSQPVAPQDPTTFELLPDEQVIQAITNAPSPSVDVEAATSAEERKRRRRRPPRISGETSIPILSLFGFELTVRLVLSVATLLLFVVGGGLLLFWLAGRVVTDTSGNFPASKGIGRPLH